MIISSPQQKLNELTRRPRLSVSATVFCFILASFGYAAAAHAGPINASEIIELTNAERTKANLPALVPNQKLSEAARLKAFDMLAGGYFAHATPDGKPFYQWIEEAGYRYMYAGENLAIDFAQSEGVVGAWMASPLHRANIVNENYSDIGLAAVRGQWNDRETTVVVQVFGSLLTDSPAVLGAALENLSNNLSIRRDSLESLAEKLAILPSIAGNTYFDIIVNPTTKVAQRETYQTLLAWNSNCCGKEPVFALTEESGSDIVSVPVAFPKAADIVTYFAKNNFALPRPPESAYLNLLTAGLLLVLLLIAWEQDIKRLIRQRA